MAVPSTKHGAAAQEAMSGPVRSAPASHDARGGSPSDSALERLRHASPDLERPHHAVSAASGGNARSLLQVLAVRVLADRVAFDVLFPEEGLRTTTPDIAARASALRPNLPIHACVNSCGRTFAAVMENTSMPHLLEHCIIDFLVEATQNETDSFQGTSRWVDPSQGLACIQISMKDDLEVLRAFKRAVRFLEEDVLGL